MNSNYLQSKDVHFKNIFEISFEVLNIQPFIWMICERGKWEGKQMELWQLFIRYGCHCPGRDTTSRLYQTVAGYKLQKCDKQYTSQIWKFHPGLRHYGSFAYVTISREIKMVNYFWLKLLIENVQWQNFDCISVSCIRCRMQKKCCFVIGPEIL